ncbi:putative LRP chaperone MESD [Dioscorea sansibarensis]
MARGLHANGVLFSFLSLLLLLLLVFVSIEISEAKKRVSIPDELDDVVDDEEDEDWKQWGLPKTTQDEAPKPPVDFSKMSLEEMQAEITRSQTGPFFGFVKLRPGVSRSREDVPLIAMKWSKILRTGSIEAKFMAVDRNTIMFNMEKGQDTEELKDFILSQPEAYEIKIGEQLHRRPGDPPLDEVIASLNREKSFNGMPDSKDEF